MPIRSYWPRKRRASRHKTEIDLVHNRINQLGRRRKLGHVLTETRASSAMVLQGNGTYVERAAGELAIGQGVGLQVSEEVVNLMHTSDLTGAVVGNLASGGSLPDDWVSNETNGTFDIEVIGLGTEKNLPYIDLRIQLSGHTSTAYYNLFTIPLLDRYTDVVVGDKFFQRQQIALIAGSMDGTEKVQALVFQRGPTYGGIPAGANIDYKPQITGELKEVAHSMELDYADVDAIDATALSLTVLVGNTLDATFRIAAPFLAKVDFVPPYVIGPGATATRAADNPVVVQGLGVELLADGDTPHNWGNNNAILTPNPDGSLVIASDGGFWHRAFAGIIPLIAGVAYRGVAKYKVGTSGLVGIWMYSATGPTQSYMSGTPGSIAQGTTTFGLFTDIVETLVGDVWEVSYTFTPSSTVPDAYPAISPQSDTAGENVTAISHTLKQVRPFPGYNPDSQAYAETLTQQIPNPIFEGTVGNSSPSNYLIEGANALTILEAEVVDGITYNPVSLRRVATTGYEGLRPRVDGVDTDLPLGTHWIIYYLRKVAGVPGTAFTAYTPGGTPNTTVLKLAADIDALPPGVMTRFAEAITVTAIGSRVSIISNSGPIGAGYDIGPFNIILNTDKDVETQTKQGAFSRILAGDGFSSTVFPSAKDLVPGRFDSQADVDLWGPSSTDPEQIIRTEVDGRMEMVRGSGAIDGQASFNVLLTAGTVYALESVVEGHLALAADFNVFVSANTGKRTDYGLAAVSGASAVRVWNFDKPTTVYVDSLSVQEVEPGVIIEAVVVLNIAPNQYVMWLVEPDSSNGVIMRCRGDGFFNMIIKKDGATLFDITSSEPYTDGIEATIRLEITDTPDGCFFAAFKDGVVIPGLMAGPIAYPDAINTLSLIPVAGVKILKKLNLK